MFPRRRRTDQSTTLLRRRMVEQQIVRRGIKDPRVLHVMGSVPRHLFVPENMRGEAYDDHPLPIGQDQTISQPYIVALMTELLEISPDDIVLEIGTGSGYQTAVLSRLSKEVTSLEVREPLARSARELLSQLGYANVCVLQGDGNFGWPPRAPYDKILVTAAPARIPEKLLEQLKIGGKLVCPVGDYFQELVVVTKSAGGVRQESSIPVRFVPMTGGET